MTATTTASKSTPMHHRLSLKPITDLPTVEAMNCRAWKWVDIDGSVVGGYGINDLEAWGFSVTSGRWFAEHYGSKRADTMVPRPVAVPLDEYVGNGWRIDLWFDSLGDRYKAMQAAERFMSIIDSQKGNY